MRKRSAKVNEMERYRKIGRGTRHEEQKSLSGRGNKMVRGIKQGCKGNGYQNLSAIICFSSKFRLDATLFFDIIGL